MPEYLAPGVFVEEVSFRAKSIEGVPTSTTGFAGMTRWGPVRYDDGPLTTEPRLVTSFTEFERVYGGLEPLLVDGGDERVCYLAHAARAFFVNGGKRLYVSRVYAERGGADGVARHPFTVGAGDAAWTARWPGAAGEVLVTTRVARGKNIAYDHPQFGRQARGAKHGALVEVDPPAPPAGGFTPPALPAAQDPLLDTTRLAVVTVDADGRQTFAGAAVGATSVLTLVELRVVVEMSPERIEDYGGLSSHRRHKRAVTRILERDDPADEDTPVWLRWAPPGGMSEEDAAIALAVALQAQGSARLAGGDDGALMSSADLRGDEADPDHLERKATGLHALGEVEDIAIVAAPDMGDLGSEAASSDAAGELVAHAELLRYRIAVVDGPKKSSLSEIREFRGGFDSTRAALYHPWIMVPDPLQPATQGAPPPQIPLPPSGFVTGIYARSDVERGVWKAPANEVVRGLSRFEANITTGRQEVLNPEGINALRLFEGRGHRVWGARTMSSDPEWKYVNVRRLFIYLEHSIDKSTQWAVFEPNGHRLWANVRQTIEDFLLTEWQNGALLGAKPEEAYFVRCDRTTMTQNDLDNGRLICLIGVAPVRPAEFVIFRIGQWTADSKLI
jgi:uncharacterized protein